MLKYLAIGREGWGGGTPKAHFRSQGGRGYNNCSLDHDHALEGGGGINGYLITLLNFGLEDKKNGKIL